MGLFDSPMPPPLPPRRWVSPDSAQMHGPLAPPKDVLPGVVALGVVLAETATTVVHLPSLSVHPQGVLVHVHVHRRRDARGSEVDPRTGAGPPRDAHPPGGEMAWLDASGAGGLRFGVRLPDGRTAVGRREHLPDPDVGTDGEDGPLPPPASLGPTLSSARGSGTLGLYRREWWLWPLPPREPPGVLAFACDWPAADVPPGTADVALGVVLAAAGRARALWHPDGSG